MTQMLATFFGRLTRHTPEGLGVKARAEAVVFGQARWEYTPSPVC